MKHICTTLCTLMLVIMTAMAGDAAARQPHAILYGPYLQNLETDEVTIVWVTNTPSVGWVELAQDGTESFYSEERSRYYDSENGIKNVSTVHSVRITGLTPATYYRYRVYAQEVVSHEGSRVWYGDYAATNVYTKDPLRFITNSHGKESVEFAMINDIHGDNVRMRDLLSQCDMSQTDLVLFNGDMATMFNTEEQVFADFMNTAVDMFAAEIPMYYTRGNHETRGTHAARFGEYFSPKKESLYFTFRQGPVQFVILDTGEDKPDSDIEYYGLVDYDNYRTEQARWLSEVVSSEAYCNAPYKVVVAHIPYDGDWHGARDVNDKLVEVLRQSAPDILLCGHLHRLVYQEADATTPFPTLVNAHNTIVKAQATATGLHIEVYDEQGKLLKTIELGKNK